MTSAGLSEAPLAPAALPSDPVWGTLQVGGREILLRMMAINIGRDKKADISLDDPMISYIHAQLVRQGSETYLRDLGSRNGTFVNRTLISMPHRLELGDEVKLGETTLIFGSGTISTARVMVPVAAPTESLVAEETSAKEQSPDPVLLPRRVSTLMLTLTVRTGELTGRAFPLDQSPLTLGRNPASQIAIPHETVSWNHAIFKQEDMKWFVKDLGSSNGTHLNDTRLPANELHPVHPGDQLKFGNMLVEVTADAS
jgi:pSer/pThr/pTyr-binding forkhead associated (FHA) protein